AGKAVRHVVVGDQVGAGHAVAAGGAEQSARGGADAVRKRRREAGAAVGGAVGVGGAELAAAAHRWIDRCTQAGAEETLVAVVHAHGGGAHAHARAEIAVLLHAGECDAAADDLVGAAAVVDGGALGRRAGRAVLLERVARARAHREVGG